MSDILDQLAGIKILLQEQAEDCRQRARYEQERRETADKQRAKTDVLEASVWENLKKIMDRREDILSQEKPVESSEDIDILMQLIKENHENQMSMILAFINDCSTFKDQQRAELLKEISRLRKKT